MKLNSDFICRQVCGETLLMPVGEKTKEYNGIFTLTETGAFLLRSFLNGDGLQTAAEKLAAEFEIDTALALQDTREFAERLTEYGILTPDDELNSPDGELN